MLIIVVHKNLIKAIMISSCLILIGVFSLHFSYSLIIDHQYRAIFTNLNKTEETAVSTFLVSLNVRNDIEIFDIEKGQVIKVVQANETMLAETQKYLEGIVGMYTKVKAIPDKGYIIKITFEPSIIVNNPYLNGYGIKSINKFFIILPEQDDPYILVLDDKERPYFYYFNGDISTLLHNLDFVTDTFVEF